jgi:hypothetical protein
MLDKGTVNCRIYVVKINIAEKQQIKMQKVSE